MKISELPRTVSWEQSQEPLPRTDEMIADPMACHDLSGGSYYETTDAGRLPQRMCIELGLPIKYASDPALWGGDFLNSAGISPLSHPFQHGIATPCTIQDIYDATPGFRASFPSAAALAVALVKPDYYLL